MNCKFLHTPYSIEQPDTRQRNGIKDSETGNVHVEVVLLRLFGSCFP